LAQAEQAKYAQTLNRGGRTAKRAPLRFSGNPLLSAQSDSVLVVSPAFAPEGELALSGPSVKIDALHLPVRGDLAHVRLAGRVFVPHYAVPMEHRVKAATALRKAGRADGEVLADLPGGALFAVLDIAGAWAWGQLGAADEDGGLVGYVALDALEPVGLEKAA
jgi:hypothetical protein